MTSTYLAFCDNLGAMFLIRFIVIMKYRALTSLQGHVLQSRRAGVCVFTIYTQSQTVNSLTGQREMSTVSRSEET